MRQFLLSVFVLFAFNVLAQNYAVYRVKGDVVLMKKKNSTYLEKGQILTPKDIVRIAAKSELKLFDEEHREMITLKNQGAGSLSSLILAEKGSRQSMTADYFAFILKNMTGHHDDVGLKAGRTTAIFRDEGDSLLSAPNQFFPALENSCIQLVPAALPSTAGQTVLGRVVMRPLTIEVPRYRPKK
jgi:hypothetical protein